MAGVFKYQMNGPEARTPDFRSGASTLEGPPTVNERNEFNEERGCLISSLSSISYAVETPKLSDKALFGVAGDIVRKIEPHTETHPAALLVQFLIGTGNMIGRGPYVLTERDEQHTNLFGVIVGESSRGRKGTSWGHVRYILAQVDPSWESFKVMGGLASGEGVIAELRDDENGNDERQDKRLLLMEGEFAQVLRVLQRDGNTLSPIHSQCLGFRQPSKHVQRVAASSDRVPYLNDRTYHPSRAFAPTYPERRGERICQSNSLGPFVTHTPSTGWWRNSKRGLHE